jgi:hypothetical protein
MSAPFCFLRAWQYASPHGVLLLDLEVHSKEAKATARTSRARQAAQVRLLIECIVQTAVNVDLFGEGVREIEIVRPRVASL